MCSRSTWRPAKCFEPEIRGFTRRLLRHRRTNYCQRRTDFRRVRWRVHHARFSTAGILTPEEIVAQIYYSSARRARFRDLAKDSDAWTRGGGPTWRSGSYDPQLDLVYWERAMRSHTIPDLAGNWIVCSRAACSRSARKRVSWFVISIHANDIYDVDATDEHVLADIPVDGQLRKVMIQANKNGFLYVLDRTNCN